MRQTGPPANAATSSTTLTAHASSGASLAGALRNLATVVALAPSPGDHGWDSLA
jgi:hypothetical protein